MMKKMAILAVVFFFAGVVDLLAFRGHRSGVKRVGIGPSVTPTTRDIRARLKMPIRLPVDKGTPVKPVHPIYPGHKPGKPGHRHPGKHRPRYWWPSSTTLVREVQPIIIVNNPAPPAPAPEPEKIWVPPVMGTRTEPGYWDHGIKKIWMGDHWRYEQDFETRKWVSESQVEIVEQEGYWKFVE